eukprot:jgi/Undpi1/12708/HiC_scaffold_6.g02376.m1
MMWKRPSSIRLAVLSYALVAFSGSVLAATESSASACISLFSGDGDCDLINNTEACGYDGGDCCECTCVTSSYTCGENGGYACLDPDAACVDDDDITTLPSSEEACIEGFLSDGDCDLTNNIDECGYDGGDCCECTCVSTDEYTCGDDNHGGFACVDPGASCVEDDDFEAPMESQGSYSYSPCIEDNISDGDCDNTNNVEECDYDGGDCCECDCVSTDEFTCGDVVTGGFDCVDPNSPCVDGLVDAGTKTVVTVSTNAYDTRPGADSNDIGCNLDGCLPELARDGNNDDIESRWSCARKIVVEDDACEITFDLEDAQDIKDVQVSFWKKDIRMRKLQVSVNGNDIGSFDSAPDTEYTALGVEADSVTSLTLTSIDLDDDEWISLIEVGHAKNGRASVGASPNQCTEDLGLAS